MNKKTHVNQTQILKAFLPAMMEKNHGHIVTIASIAGLIGAYQLTDYSASKFAAGKLFSTSLRKKT